MAKSSKQNTDLELENKMKELCRAEIDAKISQLKGKWVTWRNGLSVGLVLFVVAFPAIYFTKQDFVKKTHNELYGSASIDDVKNIINSTEVESTYQAKIALNRNGEDKEQFTKDFVIFKAKPNQYVKIYLKTYHSNNQDKRTYSIMVNTKRDSNIKDGLSTLNIKGTKPESIVEHEDDKYIQTIGFDLNDFDQNFKTSDDVITVKCIIFVYGKI